MFGLGSEDVTLPGRKPLLTASLFGRVDGPEPLAPQEAVWMWVHI